MKRKTHRRMQENLLLFLDGDLSGSRRQDVEEHILKCADCRRRLDSLGDIWRSEPGPGLDPPESLWQEIAARLDETASRHRRIPAIAASARRLATSVIVAAAVSLSVAAGVFLGKAADAAFPANPAIIPGSEEEIASELGLDRLRVLSPNDISVALGQAVSEVKRETK